MLQTKIFDPHFLAQAKASFQQAKPYRFLVIDDFLDPVLAASLADHFPSLDSMDVQYKGLNEKKAEHAQLNELHPDFSRLRNLLSDQRLTESLETITGIKGLELIHDRYGSGLHQGGSGSFLDIHVDYNLHPTLKKQRRFNLILFLNTEWKEEWGGALELWNKDMSACGQKLWPLFNRAVIFECHDHSFHGYDTITCPAHITRKSVYQYYFTIPENKLIFHDTIFRTKPDEGMSKKLLVPFKEMVKNNVKRVLYYLGLSRFLR